MDKNLELWGGKLSKSELKNRKKRKWIRVVKGFKEKNRLDEIDHLSKTAEERLSDIQFCRENYSYLKGRKNANRKGLRRVLKIIKKTQG